MIAGTAGATRAAIPGPANLWRCRPARCRSSNRRDTSAGGWTEAAARPSRGSRRRSWASRSLPATTASLAVGGSAGSRPLRCVSQQYPLGPRFAGPRQWLAGGCAPSDPPPTATAHHAGGGLTPLPPCRRVPMAERRTVTASARVSQAEAVEVVRPPGRHRAGARGAEGDGVRGAAPRPTRCPGGGAGPDRSELLLLLLT